LLERRLGDLALTAGHFVWIACEAVLPPPPNPAL
jgi:hypothetical protein